MSKASETTGAVADLIRLVSAAATSECYSIAGKMSELKAEAMTAETEETTAMAKAGRLLPWILMVGGAAATAVSSSGWRRGRPIVGMYCSFHVESRSFSNVQKTTSIYTNKK